MHGFMHRRAAEEIRKNLATIDAEAGQAGQVAQDADAEHDVWVTAVADIIAANMGERQALCWYEKWRGDPEETVSGDIHNDRTGFDGK